MHSKLNDAANRPTSYYKSYPDEDVQESASSMAVMAEALDQAVAYTGAEVVIILKKKTADAVAGRIHHRALDKVPGRPLFEAKTNVIPFAPTPGKVAA